MEQKIEEIKKEDGEQAREYLGFIKESVDSGKYFKDALDWYFFRYVTPICDRTLLIFGAIVAAVVLYFLYQMIQSAFPLVERDPIFIKSVDQSRYFPSLVRLKPKEGQPNYDPAITNIDEAVAKYLLTVYLEDRESYDFSKAEISDVNLKFNRIRNTSSAAEYKNFQLFMSKDNPNSPIQNFGQKVVKSVKIDSVHFIKKTPQNLFEKAQAFFSDKVANNAEIRFTATTKTTTPYGEVREDRERYLAKINFNFDGVDAKEKNRNITFIVNKYQLFKVR